MTLTLCRLGSVLLAGVVSSACGGGDSAPAASGGNGNSSGGNGSGVTLPDCTNYYGTGVTDDMRWRGDTVPCPDANRVRTVPRPFVLDGVTAEYVYYAD